MKRLRITEQKDRISFYTELPFTSFHYDKFKDLITTRIKILRTIESSLTDVRICSFKSIEEDILSHFFCRLICAHTQWSIKWFINMETQLFKLKVESYSTQEVKHFFNFYFLNNLTSIVLKDGNLYVPRESEYKASSVNSFKECKIFLHFSKVPDLVSVRVVKLKKGYCELNETSMKSFIVNEFRNYLEKKMNALNSKILQSNDERLIKIHESVFQQTKDVGTFSSFKDIEKFFPPCISGIIQRIKTQKHLKYWDRQTLTLFLKECGMKVDDTISFFRSNFKSAKDVFDKEYLYSIRHNYGLEGKRANYPCYACPKIISNTGQTNFGCPFVNNLEYIKQYKSKNLEINDIEDNILDKNYQKSCTMVLESLINKKGVNLISSPLMFYQIYKKSLEEKEESEIDKSEI